MRTFVIAGLLAFAMAGVGCASDKSLDESAKQTVIGILERFGWEPLDRRSRPRPASASF